MQRFEGRVAIVTGGASGIGRAIVRRMSAEGAIVCIADMDETGAQALVEECGASTFFVRTDVSDFASAETMAAMVHDRHGRVDVLCNNAGIADYGTTTQISTDQWRRVMSVDLDGVFHVSKAVLPLMINARKGAIINTASIAGMGGFANMTAYSTAKAGVINFTRTAALDHAADGIRVNAICPGLIATEMTVDMWSTPEAHKKTVSRVPVGRWADPAEVAAAVAFLASDDASYVTGCIMPVDGGVSCAIRRNESP